jgi:hypothetical protein
MTTDFLDMTQKAQVTKKEREINLIEIKNLCNKRHY